MHFYPESALLARVKAQIRRNSSSKDIILEIGTLVLNSNLKRVTRADQEIVLTSKEYALLEYLMRKKGGISSETDLLDHVWDYNYDGLSNIIAVNIKNLRNKVDKAFSNQKPLIHTVRGLGYSIHE